MAASCSTFRIAQIPVTRTARKTSGPQHQAALTPDASQTSPMAACYGPAFLTTVVRSSSSTTSRSGNSKLKAAKLRKSRLHAAELLLVRVLSANESAIKSANYNYRPTARRLLSSYVVKCSLLRRRMVVTRRVSQTALQRSITSRGRLTVVDWSTFRIVTASRTFSCTTSARTQKPNSPETRLMIRRLGFHLTASCSRLFEARKSFV